MLDLDLNSSPVRVSSNGDALEKDNFFSSADEEAYSKSSAGEKAKANSPAIKDAKANSSASEDANSNDIFAKNSDRNDFGVGRSLAVGSIFDNVEEVYDLYCEYGRLMGFSVKKGSQAYLKGTLELRMKVYLCSCEGRYDDKRSVDRKPAYQKQTHRTDCKARLRVCRAKKDLPWKVTVFKTTHNHELVPQSAGYLLRSSRTITIGKGLLLEALHSAGIGVNRSHRFLANEAGGIQNVGFVRKDAYNHLRKCNTEHSQPDGDANALVKLFLQRANMENNFYSNIDTDVDGRIVNFFFRDSRCKIDYMAFGDVITVDTTYKTNKYLLYCVPFTGVNHHRNNVLFGVGFLSNERTESFEWLFNKFLESMDGKEPEVVFTDQCQALMTAVDYTFQTASHRLCQWHINRNTSKHFGKLRNNAEFKKQWMHCMNGCETVEEFETKWTEMIDGSKPITSRDWFKHMHKLRKRWASVFTQDRFSAGIHATSRSESTNRVLKDLCSASTTLHAFVIQYERVLKEWREAEAAEDAANRGVLGGLFNTNLLLIHAASLYTQAVFRLYEVEAVKSLEQGIALRDWGMQSPILVLYSFYRHI